MCLNSIMTGRPQASSPQPAFHSMDQVMEKRFEVIEESLEGEELEERRDTIFSQVGCEKEEKARGVGRGHCGEFYFCCEDRNTQIYLETECIEPVEKMLKMRKEITGKQKPSGGWNLGYKELFPPERATEVRTLNVPLWSEELGGACQSCLRCQR
jgi:hypothetical protein